MAIDVLKNHLPGIRENGIVTDSTVTLTGTVTLPTLTTQTITTATLTTANATTLNVSGVTTAKSAATVPASAGAVAAGAPITIFSDGPSIYVTSDVPAFSAIKGSLCINTAGSSSSTRLYVNNGTTNWVAVTTAS